VMLMRRERGFTAIEMLIVVAILGIVAGLGVPRVLGMVAGYQVETARSIAVQQLRNARLEAIGRNRSVEWVLLANGRGVTRIVGGADLTRSSSITVSNGIGFTLSGFAAPSDAVRFSKRGNIINIAAGQTGQLRISRTGSAQTREVGFVAGTGLIQ